MSQISKNELREKMFSGFMWKFASGYSTTLVNFIVSLILARLLNVADYGIVATASIFFNILNVFVEHSFASALVQAKALEEKDISTVLISNIILSSTLYLLLFIASDYIAQYFNEPLLKDLLRVQGLLLIVGGISSVLLALQRRQLQYKVVFIAGAFGCIGNLIVGLSLAFLGAGAWAIVFSNIASQVVVLFVYLINMRLRVKFCFSTASFKKLFSFSGLVLCSAFLNTCIVDIRAFVIGKVYTSEQLGYYSKGAQFPQMLMSNTVGAVDSVLLPSLSKYQNDQHKLLTVFRRYIRTATFILLPVMFGLMAVADAAVEVLLTEKWLSCVTYLRLICITYMFRPYESLQQAYFAFGNSKRVLHLVIGRLIITLLSIVITLRISVMAVVIGMVLGESIYILLNLLAFQHDYGYTIKMVVKDTWQNWLLSITMAITTYCVGTLNMPIIIKLFTQIIVGVSVFILTAKLLKSPNFDYVLQLLKSKLSKQAGRH